MGGNRRHERTGVEDDRLTVVHTFPARSAGHCGWPGERSCNRIDRSCRRGPPETGARVVRGEGGFGAPDWSRRCAHRRRPPLRSRIRCPCRSSAAGRALCPPAHTLPGQAHRTGRCRARRRKPPAAPALPPPPSRLKPPPALASDRAASTSAPRSGSAGTVKNHVHQQVAEVEQPRGMVSSGYPLWPSRTASSSRARSSRPRLLTLTTVARAVSGNALAPWQAPQIAPVMAAIVSQSPPSDAAMRQASHGSSGQAAAIAKRGGDRLLGRQAGTYQPVHHVHDVAGAESGHQAGRPR